MKLTIQRRTLNAALATVARGKSSDSVVPIFGGVLIGARGRSVTMRTTDGMQSVVCTVDAAVEEEGATVAPCATLQAAVKNFPDEPVGMELEGSVLSVRCARTRLNLATLDPTDFPEFPDVEPDSVVSIPSDAFRLMAKVAVKAVGTDNSKPQYTGVLVAVEDGCVRMVATDTYRFVVASYPTDAEAGFGVIVPAKAVRAASATAVPGDDVTLWYSESQVAFEAGGTKYVTRRIDGQFVDWSDLFGRFGPTGTTVRVDAGEMARALSHVGVVADDTKRVSVEVRDGVLELLASSPSTGEASERIAVDVEGDGFAIAVNYAFLKAAVREAEGEARILVTRACNAVFVEYDDPIDTRHLVMPVRS